MGIFLKFLVLPAIFLFLATPRLKKNVFLEGEEMLLWSVKNIFNPSKLVYVRGKVFKLFALPLTFPLVPGRTLERTTSQVQATG